MVESHLGSVQAALLEQALADVNQQTETSLLSPILTSYLDTLLRSATEIPESLIAEFACLRFSSGGMVFLSPLSRIERIEYASDARRRFAYQMPDYPSTGRFMFRIRESKNWFFFDEIEGLDKIASQDVIWRGQAAHAPWFIGTHRKQLCRIFDPEVLIDCRDIDKKSAKNW